MSFPTAINGLQIYDSQPGLAVPPIPINFYSALSTPAYFRAINFIADNLSSLERSVTLNGIVMDTPHPLTKLLERRPNGYQNSTMFWRTLFFHAAHYNNGYGRIDRDPVTQAPIALHNLLPENILPFRYDDGKGGGPVQYFGDTATRKVWPGADIIHIAGASYDGMRGIDTVALNTGTLQQASTIERFQTKFLQKGTNIMGTVEFQGAVTKEQFAEVRDMIRDRFSGIESDEILLLGNNATYKNATLSPQVSQLMEQKALTTKSIAQITGVDPYFLFDKSESKYAGAAEAGENVVRFTLRPWIDQIENELSVKLLSDAEMDQGHWIEVDASDLTAGDEKTVTELAMKKKAGGVITGNETRAELGYPKLDDPDGDKLKTLGDTAPPPAE